jgi:hypothetical protein
MYIMSECSALHNFTFTLMDESCTSCQNVPHCTISLQRASPSPKPQTLNGIQP